MSFIMNFTSKAETDSFDYPIIQENIKRKVGISHLSEGIHGPLYQSEIESD